VRVALITGHCPPGDCGVGDYTACLAKALNSRAVETHLITSRHWGLFDAFAVSKTLGRQKFDIVHIEYPTLGFEMELGPQGLSLLQSCVISLHEASQLGPRGRLMLFPFTLRSQHIIFTSQFELGFAAKWFPWTARNSSVIPVGSNIRPVAQATPRAFDEIVYFGLLIPRKELEQVLEMAAFIKTSGLPLRIRVIGRVPHKHISYFEELKLRAAGLPIIWDRDLDEEQTGKRLAVASIAYLPYSDGASERRTTLKAALLNGLAVVTTRGPHTPSDLEGVVRFCRNPQEALATIRSLVENPQEISKMASNARRYGQQYSWERIAAMHLEVYESVLSKRRSGIKNQRLNPNNVSKSPSLP
jgi:glycosyltransferase involved in cell wall biosynthesis